MKLQAIIALPLNLAVPGLGSVIGGKTRVGVVQLLLTTFVSITVFAGAFEYLDVPNILIGVVAVFVLLWALMTSTELLQQGKK